MRSFSYYLSRIKNRIERLRHRFRPVVFSNQGFCPICQEKVVFIARDTWFRDYYHCGTCGSIPRERALMDVLCKEFPNWKDLVIHESSPVKRGASVALRNGCKNYIPSQFFPDVAHGSYKYGFRCENLEALTFENSSIDLHITQDVFEHVLEPEMAFKEIARTLKPGGAHIFTVPLVNKENPTEFRAEYRHDEIHYIKEPQYHGNPVNEKGSLVTVDWGFDIIDFIYDSSGLYTEIIQQDDLDKGIRAEYIDVLITRKPERSDHNKEDI